MRLVSTSRKTGPSPERACSSASCAASKTAWMSWPSTLIARMSYASARFDMSSQTGECCQPGVDSAQWLFSHTKTVFVFHSCARLSDSWKVPMFVAPLEREAGARDRRQAAADDGVRAHVAALDVVEMHRAAVTVRAALHLP